MSVQKKRTEIRSHSQFCILRKFVRIPPAQLYMGEHIVIDQEFLFLANTSPCFPELFNLLVSELSHEFSLGLGKILRITPEDELSGRDSEDRMSRTLRLCLE